MRDRTAGDGMSVELNAAVGLHGSSSVCAAGPATHAVAQPL